MTSALEKSDEPASTTFTVLSAARLWLLDTASELPAQRKSEAAKADPRTAAHPRNRFMSSTPCLVDPPRPKGLAVRPFLTAHFVAVKLNRRNFSFILGFAGVVRACPARKQPVVVDPEDVEHLPDGVVDDVGNRLGPGVET